MGSEDPASLPEHEMEASCMSRTITQIPRTGMVVYYYIVYIQVVILRSAVLLCKVAEQSALAGGGAVVQ